MAIQSINPATGEKLETYAEMHRAEVDEIVDKTHEAFLAWRRIPLEERAQRLRAAAQILRTKAEAWARLMAREMGKPLRDGIAEAQKCALCCEYFADKAAQMLAREPVKT
jgi:succinate-semialdehyde dehydrogenase / glutarate-semialdehyde dehydrogenase